MKTDRPDPTAAAASEGKPDPFVGSTVGNSEIVERISEGGSADIYLAYNAQLRLHRVVKILKPSLMDNEEFFKRFSQEAQLMARLDHPNILRVFDSGFVQRGFYIEMEHIAGQTLRALLEASRSLSEREALSIALQVASALEYAHSVQLESPRGEKIRGILHRDLKPENIMITPEKNAKLMDFGAAKPLNVQSMTAAGTIVGTFHYMSPEQLEGEKLSFTSDFFSLGIVLYEMLTGRNPFDDENLSKVVSNIKSGRYTRVRALKPSVSRDTERLVDRLLARNPHRRPTSAAEIRSELELRLAATTLWGGRAALPFARRRTVALALFLSLAALAVSVVALLRAFGLAFTR
jgi:serine/threonine-protein kinase